MHKIETQVEFLQWAKEVNHSRGTAPDAKALCDLQDVFARSYTIDLQKFFIGSSHSEKELLVFSIQKAMGSEILFDFIKIYSNHKAQEWIDKDQEECNKRWNAALEQVKEVKEYRESIDSTMKDKDEEITRLDDLNSVLSAKSREQYNIVTNLRVELVDLKAELEEANETITELRQFENHILNLLRKAEA